jgi:tetratricopeptide (TPR) repeat protein
MNDTIEDASIQGSFFRRIDWAAFWTATLISFLVYFFTLAPTVTLEDSGELATAGAHWGVPHPPGYPIWAFCANLFTWAFQWVTFRGQPTPAWSIALMSAVFGALATGFTAMLIARSSSDILHATRQELAQAEGGRRDLICWAGGVAGSLVFAFSPVMWSQATIVEAYSLNAFFLMWVFLLTYRWMRRPSDKVLWLTAFVFGLGLTNYQVLLLAALPLVVVILLRDVALFRDFLLLGIPFGLTMLDLSRGALPPTTPGFGKLTPLLTVADAPSMPVFVSGLGVFLLAVAVTLVLDGLSRRHERIRQIKLPVVASMFGLALVAMLTAQGITHPATYDSLNAPLVHPANYLLLVTVVLGVVACSVVGALAWRGKWSDPWVVGPLVVTLALLLMLWAQLARLPMAPPPPMRAGAVAFSWTLPTLAFFGACALLFLLLWQSPRGIFFALAVFAVQAVSFGLLRKGALLGLTHPTTWWFWAPAAWNFLLLALAWLMLPHGRTTVLSVLCAELGVSFYIYMPIVSDLNNPPMNWGYPRTWEGFKHALTRGQYEKIAPTNIFTWHFVEQIGAYFKDLRVQFTLLVAPLGFLPFAAWQFHLGRRTVRALYVAIGLFLVSCVFVVIGWHSGLDETLRLDKFLIGGIMLLMLVGIGAMALNQIAVVCERTWQKRAWSEIITLGAVLSVVAAGVCAFSARGVAGGFWMVDMKSPQAIRMLILAFILSALVLTVLLTLAFVGKRVASRVFGFRVSVDEVMQQWLIATVGGFLVMSVLLIVLANPKGDLQDTFIQKVKFVSSHALFAIWIGYGLVFGLEMFDTLLDAWRRRLGAAAGRTRWTLLRTAAIGIVLAVSAIPIYENYTNEQLVYEFGASEQNGHDYGWQFGNYQMRGAEAVREELEADEEPIPNPLYPRAMGTNAVFFGGTDPGRFVPTYMIYCAKVRYDVFLITQNALADNTYMSVMRDLYGDKIYIPTPDDSGRAFQIYVEEVESGKRPRNADLVVENGRVQVSGALGVMEINGILCDMIFKNNKARHNFYIEESYVIGWMFPYLAPHGLIMQIRPERGPITPENVRNDMDFWDWYTRRLTRDDRFRRDVVAQKSFSKLRSAIGGLYAATGWRTEAEQAYQEARIFYPVSPEANFRLIQEVLLTQGRFDEALDIITKYNQDDPNNERGRSFSDWIMHLRNTNAKVRELLSRAQTTNGRMDAQTAYEIGMCYRDLGNNDVAMRYIEPLASVTGLPANLMFAVGSALSGGKRHDAAVKAMDQILDHLPASMPPQQLLDLARVYEAARRPDRMVIPLNRYLQLQPNDWRAWLDLATLHALGRQGSQAQAALRRAFDFGREEALKAAQVSEILRPLVAAALQQRGAAAPVERRPFGPYVTP